MRIANSNISMSSSREFSQGVRVTSRNRLLSVSANSSSPQTRNREKNATFEFSGKSFSKGRRFNSYTNDGKKQSYTSSGYSIEHQAIKAKLKIIEKEEKAKEPKEEKAEEPKEEAIEEKPEESKEEKPEETKEEKELEEAADEAEVEAEEIAEETAEESTEGQEDAKALDPEQ